MNTRKRLTEVAQHLSPKQLVMAQVREMQQTGSILEYARTLSQKPAAKSLMQQVTDGVEARLRRVPKVTRDKAAQDAMREACFLSMLARCCSLEIIERAQELRLRGRVVELKQALVMVMTLHDHDLEASVIEDVCDAVMEFDAEVRGYMLATRTIGRQYFDEMPLLSKDAEAFLDFEIERAKKLARWAGRVKAGLASEARRATRGASAAPRENAEPAESRAARARADELIAAWVATAKIHTHDKFGEDAAAAGIADELLERSCAGGRASVVRRRSDATEAP
ncbi:MAG: hypothetical protein JSR77_18725 [Planctomycetes bacterium]|nr:hypothetical protein [Planctomycetota bacterium]